MANIDGVNKIRCCTCKGYFDVTTDFFYTNALQSVAKNPNLIKSKTCKSCAKAYGKAYRQKLKTKGLTRSGKQTIKNYIEGTTGVVYVIGTSSPEIPYKIGISSSNNLIKRKSALQTSHWLDLHIAYQSELVPKVKDVERKLHEHFESKHVRGEWYALSQKDVKMFGDLVKNFVTGE